MKVCANTFEMSNNIGKLSKVYVFDREYLSALPSKCEKWTHWDLNPGLSACEADVIPIHHVPHGVESATHLFPHADVPTRRPREEARAQQIGQGRYFALYAILTDQICSKTPRPGIEHGSSA